MTFDIELGALSLVRDHEARERFRPLDGLPDLAAAYRVQHAYVRRIIGDDEVAGYKIGLTSHRMQTMCGISHPIAGVVFGKRVKQSGTTLRVIGDDDGLVALSPSAVRSRLMEAPSH